MSATAESYVKEATLTWLDELGYAIPTRRTAPGGRGAAAGYPLRTFTLRFNSATERFDESAVTGFLVDKEVVSLQNHVFVQNDVPDLLVIGCYRVAAYQAGCRC